MFSCLASFLLQALKVMANIHGLIKKANGVYRRRANEGMMNIEKDERLALVCARLNEHES
jgi:hypothetical protein